MGSTEGYIAVDGFRTFEVPGLASDKGATPIGMREDLLLLSWLIVLLRTREDGQASFEWAYSIESGGQHGGKQELETRTLSTDQVMPNLQIKVGDVASAISSHTATQPPEPRGHLSKPSSLLLSTGTLSRTSEGAKDDVSVCPEHVYCKCK